jgi:CheY-like chemotaxis protein
MVRRTFANVLAVELPNLSIDQAKDGNAAIEAFRKDRHNVILMDLSMPVKDGLAAFMEIEKLCREEKWAMPSVVFCTGYDPSQAVRNVVAGNPQHCMLRKPVGSSILVDAVRSRLLS